MKILDTPCSGKCGRVVAYPSPYGLCCREHVPQNAPLTPARQHVCAIFGSNSRKWSARLTNEPHERWILAGAQVMSRPRLAARGPLTGHQLWSGISATRAIVGLPETFEVPPRPVFGPSKVGRLVIENDDNGVRLYLAVSGQLNEDIMVFGQEPCSRGRYKRRNVSCLGLQPPPIGGPSEITHLYKAKFGQPRPGQKIFLLTCQEKEGWKGLDRETSATVPERAEGAGGLEGLNALKGLNGVAAGASGFLRPGTPAAKVSYPYAHREFRGCPGVSSAAHQPIQSGCGASQGITDGPFCPPGATGHWSRPREASRLTGWNGHEITCS